MIVNGFGASPSFYLQLNLRRRLQILIKLENIINGFNRFTVRAHEDIPAFQAHIVKYGIWPDACQTKAVRFSISEVGSYSDLFHQRIDVSDGGFHL